MSVTAGEDDFVKQVRESSNSIYGQTEQEKNKLLHTYNSWSQSLHVSVNEACSSVRSDSFMTVSPSDVFRCLFPVVNNVYTLLTCEMISVSQCLGLSNSTCFKMEDDVRMDVSANIAIPQLKHRSRMILVCQISPNIRRGGHVGLTFVSDKTGYIPCQVPSPLAKDFLTMVDKWVVLTSWNLISQKGKSQSYIEVCHLPVPVHPELTSHNLSVVSADDAKLILQYKDMLKIDCINIYSKVVAVSEVFRVKTDLLFCIQLTSNINLIVKNTEYLYWQTLIIPQEEYVFTNIKPTTLKKGAGEMVKVFVPWKDSKILPACKTDCLIVPLMDFLHSKHVSSDVIQEINKICEYNTNQNDEHEDLLCNYQGIITSTKHAKQGFYTLDHKIGLYVCCVPAVFKYSTLRVGCRIIVHNAHMKSSSKTPKLKIMCCLTSCIKIVEFSPLDHELRNFDPTSFLQQLFWKYGLNKQQLDNLITMFYNLESKLYPNFNRNLGQILQMILQPKLDAGSVDKFQRNYLHEFLATDGHKCCLNRDTEAFRIVEVPELKDVVCMKNADIKLCDKMKNLAECCKPGENINDVIYWVYKTDNISMDQIIVGKLQLSPDTGHIQLCDKTGCVNCVIAEAKNDHNDHQCVQECQVIRPGSTSNCPWIHPSFVGSVIAVSKFTVVTETFTLSDYQSSRQFGLPNFMKNSKTDVYIQFSLRNAIFLKTMCNLEKEERKTCQKRKFHDDFDSFEMSSSTKMGKKEVSLHEQVFLIRHVESLLLDGKRSHPKLRFSAIGYILKIEDLNSVECHQLISKILSEKQNEPEYSNKTGEIIGSGNVLDRVISLGKSQTIKNNKLPVHTLLFQGRAVRWFNCIIPGQLYQFSTIDGEIDFHKSRVTSWHLKKAVSKAGGKSCIVLPEDITCERIFTSSVCSENVNCYLCNDKELTVSVKDIKADSYDEVLVSFVCQIISRVHVKSEFQNAKNVNNDSVLSLGVSTLGNRAVKLLVRCVTTNEDIHVYMNLENSTYPHGLLPGAEVHFYKLERKISKSGSIYCQYIAVSRVRILKYALDLPFDQCISSDIHDKHQLPENKQNFDKVTFMYLADLWRCRDLHSIFKCVCHVQKVLKISLKCVCSTCGTEMVHGKCGSVLCVDDTGNRFISRASLLVEDGTGVAIVTCVGQDLKDILMISEEEWQSLQECIGYNGEIFLQQMNQTEGNGLERFVAVLCENFEVKRPLVMYMTPKILSEQNERRKVTASTIDLNNMDLEDFPYKTVETGICILETRCLPFLQLQCHGVEELDHSKWTSQILATSLDTAHN